MRYLITSINPPALSNYFDAENNFDNDISMIVYDLFDRKYTVDGVIWQDIIIDHL